jgi:hypothetical protein
LTVKTIGFLPSEKVTGFNWSGVGDIFNVFETEYNKVSLHFYMIVKDENVKATSTLGGPK